MSTPISLPRSLVEELLKRAGERGLSVEEYLADLVILDPDPRERARKYISGALELLEQAVEELGKGDLRQASERIWGACALSIKAYALVKEGRVLETHADLWVYKSIAADDLGEWVRESWYAADTMHRNFYENLADRRDVEKALESVSKLVKTIAERISRSHSP